MVLDRLRQTLVNTFLTTSPRGVWLARLEDARINAKLNDMQPSTRPHWETMRERLPETQTTRPSTGTAPPQDTSIEGNRY